MGKKIGVVFIYVCRISFDLKNVCFYLRCVKKYIWSKVNKNYF